MRHAPVGAEDPSPAQTSDWAAGPPKLEREEGGDDEQDGSSPVPLEIEDFFYEEGLDALRHMGSSSGRHTSLGASSIEVGTLGGAACYSSSGSCCSGGPSGGMNGVKKLVPTGVAKPTDTRASPPVQLHQHQHQPQPQLLSSEGSGRGRIGGRYPDPAERRKKNMSSLTSVTSLPPSVSVTVKANGLEPSDARVGECAAQNHRAISPEPTIVVVGAPDEKGVIPSPPDPVAFVPLRQREPVQYQPVSPDFSASFVSKGRGWQEQEGQLEPEKQQRGVKDQQRPTSTSSAASSGVEDMTQLAHLRKRRKQRKKKKKQQQEKEQQQQQQEQQEQQQRQQQEQQKEQQQEQQERQEHLEQQEQLVIQQEEQQHGGMLDEELYQTQPRDDDSVITPPPATLTFATEYARTPLGQHTLQDWEGDGPFFREDSNDLSPLKSAGSGGVCPPSPSMTAPMPPSETVREAVPTYIGLIKQQQGENGAGKRKNKRTGGKNSGGGRAERHKGGVMLEEDRDDDMDVAAIRTRLESALSVQKDNSDGENAPSSSSLNRDGNGDGQMAVVEDNKAKHHKRRKSRKHSRSKDLVVRADEKVNWAMVKSLMEDFVRPSVSQLDGDEQRRIQRYVQVYKKTKTGKWDELDAKGKNSRGLYDKWEGLMQDMKQGTRNTDVHAPSVMGSVRSRVDSLCSGSGASVLAIELQEVDEEPLDDNNNHPYGDDDEEEKVAEGKWAAEGKWGGGSSAAKNKRGASLSGEAKEQQRGGGVGGVGGGEEVQDIEDCDGRMLNFHLCAYNGMAEELRLFVDRDVNLDAKDNYGASPLLLASERGHLAAVRLLVTAGASLVASDENCYTALHLAAFYGHLEVVAFLLESGAEVTAVDHRGRTPRRMAKTKIIAQLIAQAEEECFKMGNKGIGGAAGIDLLAAVARNDLRMVERYMMDTSHAKRNPRRLDQKGRNGMTCLHVACLHNYVEMVALLLEGGADCNHVDDDGDTPLHLAYRLGSYDMVKSLCEAGADISKPDANGKIPMDLPLPAQDANAGPGGVNQQARGHGDKRVPKTLDAQMLQIMQKETYKRGAQQVSRIREHMSALHRQLDAEEELIVAKGVALKQIYNRLGLQKQESKVMRSSTLRRDKQIEVLSRQIWRWQALLTMHMGATPPPAPVSTLSKRMLKSKRNAKNKAIEGPTILEGEEES